MSAYYQDMIRAKEEGKLGDEVGAFFIRASRAKSFHSRRFDRALKNWRYYLALDTEYGLGQYELKQIAWAKAQDRRITTYNICKTYVDQIASGIMQAPFNPEFYPVHDDVTSLTEGAKNAAFSDKELCDWGTSYFELVRAGLIHQGVLKMVITDKYHDLGNIAFNYMLPNHWYADPMWVTIHTKDCRICWEEFFLMPDMALETYAGRMGKRTDVKEQLDELIARYRNGKNLEYGILNGPTPFALDDQTWGSALKFIAEYRMTRQKYTATVYRAPEGDVEIPDTLRDAKAKIDWMHQRFGFEKWDPYSIEEYEDKKNVCMKQVICPTLTWADIIDEAPCEVQVDQIPFFVWSSDRVNGEPHGIIDSIKDPQDDINYLNQMANHKIETEGGGGGQFADPEGFESPEECEAYVKYRNDPARTWKTAPGLMIRHGNVPARPIITSQFSGEVYKRLEHIISVLLPQISKVVPATRGQAEGTGESGYAFNLKKIQADQAVYTIHYMLRQFWNQVYEGYLIQAATQYSLGGVERKFTSHGGRNTVIFNERITLSDGSQGIRNDASMLRKIRHKVIIGETQDTPTKRIEDMRLLNDYLQSIAPLAAQKPVTVSYLTSRMASLIDPLSEEDKEALREIGAEEVETALLNLKLQKVNIQNQLSQLTNPPMMQPVAPQGTAPAQPQAAAAPEASVAIPIPEQAPQAPQGVPQ